MSLILLTPPKSDKPIDGDFSRFSAILQRLCNFSRSIRPTFEGVIPAYTIINFAGVLYYSDGDTPISGSQTEYIKCLPAADRQTLVASFVDKPTCFWNNIYNGYYDSAGALYLFQECRGILDNVIDIPKTELGIIDAQPYGQSLKKDATVTFNQIDASLNTRDIVPNFLPIGNAGVLGPNLFFGGDIDSTSYAIPTGAEQLRAPFRGAVRLSFYVRLNNDAPSGTVAYGRVFINNIGVGTTYVQDQYFDTTYLTQDFNIEPYDVITIKAYTNNPGNAITSNAKTFVDSNAVPTILQNYLFGDQGTLHRWKF